MSKLINVSNEIYEKLSKLKGENSYSEVLRKLLEHKTNKEAILSFVGKKGIDEKSIIALKKEWKEWSKKYA